MKTLKLFLVSLLLLFGIFLTCLTVKAEPGEEEPVEQTTEEGEENETPETNETNETNEENPKTPEEPAENGENTGEVNNGENEGEVNNAEPEPTEEQFESTVAIQPAEYGEVLCDIEGGKIGDEVTLYVKPNLFCKLVAVYVNDVELVPDENGNYKFLLADGENNVKPVFEIDNEKVAEVAKMLNDLKGRSLKDLFTFDNLLILFYFVLTAVMTSGYFVTILKSKKMKISTINEVTGSIQGSIDAETSKAIKGFLEDAMKPILENVSAKLVNVDETCKVLARCMILSQEDTPAARLAIIDELTKVQKTEEDLATQVREIISIEVAKREQQLEEKKNTIAELEAANESIVVENNNEEVKGRY